MTPFVLSTGAVHAQGTGLPMCLNRYGRWTSIGNRHVPILTWPTAEAAQAAGIIATTARGRTIRAVPACATTTTSSGYLPYTNEARAALLASVPYSPALASRAERLQAKTRACSEAVHAAFLQGLDGEAVKAASQSLRAQGWGALTFFSAAQHLTGMRALELVDELQELGGNDAGLPKLVQAIAVAGALLCDEPIGPRAAASVAQVLQIHAPILPEPSEQAAA